MVESERVSNRSRRRSTSEFFLCFSRSVAASSSSSSMKLNSKSILSPGRSRESSVSLSSSLSRRLRSNGSMKGGGGQASPMFPTGSKKKGGAAGGGGSGGFEPPEPSSPKVTCIGQVRVKSKRKHGRKLRTRSQRRGEVSFRKNEQQDGNGNGNVIGIHHQHQHQQPPPQPQQRWVHLSLSICETLRAFGAELSCFYPCGRSSSCSWSGDREKGEKRRGGRTSSSCGAVFARWLFTLQESEDKHSDHHRETVVQESNGEMVIERRIERREAPREIEMEVEQIEELELSRREEQEDDVLDTEEARTSICIPPKNALLLMRSRSAPFRMSSLANRFWESPTAHEEEEEQHYEDEIEIHDYISLNGKKQKETVEQEAMEEESRNDDSSTTNSGNQTKLDVEETKEEEMVEKWGSIENLKEPQNPTKEEEMTEPQDEEEDEGGMVEESPRRYRKGEDLKEERSSTEAFRFEDSISKVEEEEKTRVVEKKEERRVSFSSSTIYLEPESESEEDEDDDGNDDEIETSLEQIAEKTIEEEEESTTLEDKNVTSQDLQEEEEEEKSVLPECLLMMMCEPKLSMEVSKETWVCSSDFNRCRPSEKKKLVQKKIEEEDSTANANANTNTDAAESKTKRMDTITESKTAHPVQPQPRRQLKKKDEFQVQPPRSSCSKVEQVLKKQSMATAVGQKLNNAGGGGGYEPFVLKRCKSEPMRRTDKLSGEVCVWKKNKLETRPPELHIGVGATGVGF